MKAGELYRVQRDHCGHPKKKDQFWMGQCFFKLFVCVFNLKKKRHEVFFVERNLWGGDIGRIVESSFLKER